jgi:hypothetical protein
MKYHVLGPCVFNKGGKAVHHMRVGAVVEVDDDQQARALVAAGKLRAVKESKPAAEPAKPKPKSES